MQTLLVCLFESEGVLHVCDSWLKQVSPYFDVFDLYSTHRPLHQSGLLVHSRMVKEKVGGRFILGEQLIYVPKSWLSCVYIVVWTYTTLLSLCLGVLSLCSRLYLGGETNTEKRSSWSQSFFFAMFWIPEYSGSSQSNIMFVRQEEFR